MAGCGCPWYANCSSTCQTKSTPVRYSTVIPVNIANFLPFHPGTVQLGVLGRDPAGLRPVPGVQPLGEQRLPAASAQPEPYQPAEGAGGLRPVEDRAQQQRGWRRRAEVSRVLGTPALGLLAKKKRAYAYTEICWWNESRMRAASSRVEAWGAVG